MAYCEREDCIHHKACYEVNGLPCRNDFAHYYSKADVVPKSEFAKELIAEIAKGCTLKDYNNIDISIGYATAMNDVLWHLTKIKQKYTEDINNESQNQT